MTHYRKQFFRWRFPRGSSTSVTRWLALHLLLCVAAADINENTLEFDRPDTPNIKELKVMCGKDHMSVKLEFDKPFNGVVFSQDTLKSRKCTHVEPYSQRLTHHFKVYYNQCATKPDLNGKYYENTIVVQYDPELLEVWDEAKRLRCQWFNAYEKTATKPPMLIADLDVIEMEFIGDNVECWMEIQDGKGPWAPPLSKIAALGSTLSLVIGINDGTGDFDMRVKSCVASNGADFSIQISDEYGCVLRRKMFSNFMKIRSNDASSTLVSYAHFLAFKFPDAISVHISCQVEICRKGCPAHCQRVPAGHPGTRVSAATGDRELLPRGKGGQQQQHAAVSVGGQPERAGNTAALQGNDLRPEEEDGSFKSNAVRSVTSNASFAVGGGNALPSPSSLHHHIVPSQQQQQQRVPTYVHQQQQQQQGHQLGGGQLYVGEQPPPGHLGAPGEPHHHHEQQQLQASASHQSPTRQGAPPPHGGDLSEQGSCQKNSPGPVWTNEDASRRVDSLPRPEQLVMGAPEDEDVAGPSSAAGHGEEGGDEPTQGKRVFPWGPRSLRRRKRFAMATGSNRSVSMEITFDVISQSDLDIRADGRSAAAASGDLRGWQASAATAASRERVCMPTAAVVTAFLLTAAFVLFLVSVIAYAYHKQLLKRDAVAPPPGIHAKAGKVRWVEWLHGGAQWR